MVGVSRVAKSGYLSGLNNIRVYPMYSDTYADKFGFTADEVDIFLQHHLHGKDVREVKQWYNGYKAGNGVDLYNPWSILCFAEMGKLGAYWVDTGYYCIIDVIRIVSIIV